MANNPNEAELAPQYDELINLAIEYGISRTVKLLKQLLDEERLPKEAADVTPIAYVGHCKGTYRY